MKNRRDRLTAVTPEELAILQAKADEMSELQVFLNKLPMGLQIEWLNQEELDRLRAVMSNPTETLCGPQLLSWHNVSRRLAGLLKIRSDFSS